MSILPAEFAQTIKTLRGISPIRGLSNKRQREIRSLFRETILQLLGMSNEEELDYLLMNGFSNKGPFHQLGKDTFTKNVNQIITPAALPNALSDKIKKEVESIHTPLAMKRDILNIYQSVEEAYPQINTKALKAEICENIESQGLISTIRPDYIDRYQTEVTKNFCNFESGDSEESFQIHGNQTNAKFENDVWEALTVVDNDNSLGPNKNKRILLFDCLYNYQIIRSVAVDVRS